MSAKSSTLRKALVGLAASAALLLTPPGAASAVADATAHSRLGHPDFSAQAHRAGLSDAQVTGLQAEVDRYLGQLGGTQIALNKIRVAKGAELTVTVPGEKYVRNLSGSATSAATAASSSCDYGHFCVYSDIEYSGTEFDWFYCDTYWVPWTTVGSFHDNQYTKTVSTFLLSTTQYTVWAPLDRSQFDWLPVDGIKIC